MFILNNMQYSSGQYGVIESWGLDEAPSNFYIIPEDLDTSVFYQYDGFVNLVLDDDCATVVGFVPNMDAYNDYAASKINDIKQDKENYVSNACRQAILAGIDVETSQGLEHFSLKETDQLNLNTALSAIQEGADSYPYHSDGNLCRIFSAYEIITVVNASAEHKLYHTTLCNHLLTWIRRAESIDELNSIVYSEDCLPEDLTKNIKEILNKN